MVPPVKMDVKSANFLILPFLIRRYLEIGWFFLHSEMRKSGVNLEKSVFYPLSIYPLKYPKSDRPLFIK